MGPGLLKKAWEKGARPSPRASEISPLRPGPEKWREGQRTEALPNFGIGLNFFENTRKYAQRNADGFNLLLMRFGFAALKTRLGSTITFLALTHRATSSCRHMQGI